MPASRYHLRPTKARREYHKKAKLRFMKKHLARQSKQLEVLIEESRTLNEELSLLKRQKDELLATKERILAMKNPFHWHKYAFRITKKRLTKLAQSFFGHAKCIQVRLSL
jgi:hypothetical protein